MNDVMKKLLRIHQSSGMLWVGNGFPVRSVFDYNGLGRELSPFLLLDYAAPYEFPPSNEKRGGSKSALSGGGAITVAQAAIPRTAASIFLGPRQRV